MQRSTVVLLAVVALRFRLFDRNLGAATSLYAMVTAVATTETPLINERVFMAVPSFLPCSGRFGLWEGEGRTARSDSFSIAFVDRSGTMLGLVSVGVLQLS